MWFSDRKGIRFPPLRFMAWIEIICAKCYKDSRLTRKLVQLSLGLWICEECAKKYGVEGTCL